MKKKINNIKVLVGFELADGRRFEVGENIADGVLPKSELEVLLEMKAIEVK